jgi:hypothetical protein
MSIDKILKVTGIIAIVPLCQVIFFCAWAVSNSPLLMLLAVIPAYIVVPLNIISIFTLVYIAAAHWRDQEFRASSLGRLLKTMLLLLAAYPLAISCFWAGFELMSASRLLVINSSGRDIHAAAVTDPEGNAIAIGLIPKDGRAKRRFKAKGEGRVLVKFQEQPAGKECVAFGYVTGGMGEKGKVQILPTLDCEASR